MNLMRLSKQAISVLSTQRPAGYESDVLSFASKQDERYVYISEDAYKALVEKYGGAPFRLTFKSGQPDHAGAAASVAGSQGLSVFSKARNFAASATRHVAAGMPKATDAQVAERFAICQGCEHFDGKACRQCGCPVVREKKFFSKLSWANESCPVGKWGPVSS
jgi:hypothetical protein